MGATERKKGRGAAPLTRGEAPGAIALVIAAALGFAGCSEGSGGGAAPAAATNVPSGLQDLNLVDFHATFTESQNDLCVTCHGTMLDRQSLDPGKPEFHKFKLDPSSGVLPDWKCTDCHKKVDLAARSGGNLRKQVDVEAICYQCHLANGIGTKLYVK